MKNAIVLLSAIF